MASIAMTTSFLGGSAVGATTKLPSTTARRGAVMVAAAKPSSKMVEVEKVSVNAKEEGNSGRRDLMLAVAAAAACSVAKIAMADEEEPKRGSAEAKKKYAQICVTMPTARICRY